MTTNGLYNICVCFLKGYQWEGLLTYSKWHQTEQAVSAMNKWTILHFSMQNIVLSSAFLQ